MLSALVLIKPEESSFRNQFQKLVACSKSYSARAHRCDGVMLPAGVAELRELLDSYSYERRECVRRLYARLAFKK